MQDLDLLKPYERFFEAMLPAKVNTEETFAWFSGLPHPLFNSITRFLPAGDVSARLGQLLVDDAPKHVPISFWLDEQNRDASLKGALEEHGFHALCSCPVMNWEVQPISLGSHIVEKAEMGIFQEIAATTFHLSSAVKEGQTKLMKNSSAIENYLVYLENEPVGTGTLFSYQRTGAIFNVSTLPNYQKRGCGRTMMQFLMHRAYELELEYLTLMSAPAAMRLYTDLGFKTVFSLEIFAKQPAWDLRLL